MTTTPTITAVSLSHNTTTVSNLERFVTETYDDALTRLTANGGVTEAYVLHTCSRVEAYVVADTDTTGKQALTDYIDPGTDSENVTWYSHDEAIRHIMRVAAGLESIVIGEDQILGQIQTAYDAAIEADAIGSELDRVILKAIRVGKRARDETDVNDGSTSITTAAIQAAERDHDISDATVLIIGAGEIATAALNHITGKAPHVIVANRTVENADKLAADTDHTTTTTITLDRLPNALTEADIVISATDSDDHIITPTTVPNGRPDTMIDLAQPRDISPAVTQRNPSEVIGLDELAMQTEQTRIARNEAIDDVEAIIDEEYDRLTTQYKRERADAVIQGMYEGADRIKQQELQTLLQQLQQDDDLTDEQIEAIEGFADSLVNQLLAAPTQSLRDAAEHDDWATIATAIRLYDPSQDDEPLAEMLPDDIPDAAADALETQ